MRKWLVRIVLAAVALFALAQVVPYGRDHSNPPTTAEPRWSAPAVRALAVRACFDCHSNRTTWPWYSNVAPMSWLVQRDVDEGRGKLNFTEWNRPQDVDANEIAEVVAGGSMPPRQYKLLHSGAPLSSVERDRLVAGLTATLRRSPPRGDHGGEGND